jgi:hypothetical protein
MMNVIDNDNSDQISSGNLAAADPSLAKPAPAAPAPSAFTKGHPPPPVLPAPLFFLFLISQQSRRIFLPTPSKLRHFHLGVRVQGQHRRPPQHHLRVRTVS